MQLPNVLNEVLVNIRSGNMKQRRDTFLLTDSYDFEMRNPCEFWIIGILLYSSNFEKCKLSLYSLALPLPFFLLWHDFRCTYLKRPYSVAARAPYPEGEDRRQASEKLSSMKPHKSQFRQAWWRSGVSKLLSAIGDRRIWGSNSWPLWDDRRLIQRSEENMCDRNSTSNTVDFFSRHNLVKGCLIMGTDA